MRISRLESPDGPEAHAWHELKVRVERDYLPEDRPAPFSWWRGDLTHPWPGSLLEVWLLHDGETVVGCAELDLPQLDNRDNATGFVYVDAACRRHGLGRRLLALLADRMREQGRSRFIFELREPLDGTPTPGAGFVESLGAERALASMRRGVQVADVDDSAYDELRARAAAHAEEYCVLQWVGEAPADALEGLAVMRAAMITDAPLDDLEWEPERWDAERIRQGEACLRARAATTYTTAVRHEPTGDLVGFTALAVLDEDPVFAWQEDTIVTAPHRGRRLGLLLKVDNYRLLRERQPGVRRVTTFNADSNAHMLTVNEALGFRPIERWTECQVDVDRLPTLR